MPRQRTRQPEKILGDMTHPDSFGTLHVGFLSWLKDRNYSVATIQHRRRYLNDFIDWAEQRSYTRPAELARNILERYQRHLAQRMNRFGKPLSFRDQGQHLGAAGPVPLARPPAVRHPQPGPRTRAAPAQPPAPQVRAPSW